MVTASPLCAHKCSRGGASGGSLRVGVPGSLVGVFVVDLGGALIPADRVAKSEGRIADRRTTSLPRACCLRLVVEQADGAPWLTRVNPREIQRAEILADRQALAVAAMDPLPGPSSTVTGVRECVQAGPTG